MITLEFAEAFEIAKSDEDLSAIDDTPLYGCALRNFKPVHTTLRAVAKLIRWQALKLNGDWDMTEIDDLANIGRTKFLIIG